MRQKRADAVDKEIGRRVRTYRLRCRLTQEALGAKLGVTFQQVQKYERGVNRIGGGRLHKVATVLGIPIAALFGEDAEAVAIHPSLNGSLSEFLSQPEASRLVLGFSQIKDDKQRQAVVALVESMGKNGG